MADSSLRSVPRYLDPHIKNKIQPQSLERYRKSVQQIMGFIISQGLTFSSTDELDALLAEWKNTDLPSKTEFEGALAGVEFVLPMAKTQLPWARAIAAAWNIGHVPKHTIPMTEGPAVFLGCHLAARGHARLGAGLILQESLGLRPSELLNMFCYDVMLPEERAEPPFKPAVLGLGTKTGTKAKRAQTVILSAPRKVALLRWLKAYTNESDKLIGYSYNNYRLLLQRVTSETGLESVGYSPRSPRSGFASDCIAAGLGYSRTRELGRWASETSLRTYVDITSAAAIQVNFKTKHLNAAVAYCCANMLSFFSGSEKFVCYPPSGASFASAATDGATGLLEGHVRRLPSAIGSLVDGHKFLEVSEQEEERHAASDGGQGADGGPCTATGGSGRGAAGRVGKRVRFLGVEKAVQAHEEVHGRGRGKGRAGRHTASGPAARQ